MDWTFGWTAIAAIATCVLAASIVLAILQVRQTRRSTNAQLAVQLFKELRSKETLNAIRDIYELKSIGSGKKLEYPQKQKINYVIDRLELLGGLVGMGIIDKKLAIEAYAGTASIRCWYQLHQYINQVRRERGYYAENYEAFARLSLDYYLKNKIKVKFYITGETDEEPLFEELQKEGVKPRTMEEIIKDRGENPNAPMEV